MKSTNNIKIEKLHLKIVFKKNLNNIKTIHGILKTYFWHQASIEKISNRQKNKNYPTIK